MSKIQWTDETWNPVVGCSIVSPGCTNCYAMKMAQRLERMGQEPYRGLTKLSAKRGQVWTGKIRCLPERLGQPLKWRKPRRIFVNSMSDLFHEDVPFEFTAGVFGVMAACPQHTFQILTKRPEQMLNWFQWIAENVLPWAECGYHAAGFMRRLGLYDHWCALSERGWFDEGWPFANVWLGVSCEDQERANERIPLLFQCPAAARFVSAEPLLGPIDISLAAPYLDWLIVGGESGPGARGCELGWIEAIVKQCQAAAVPVFVKQLGAKPYEAKRATTGPQGTEDALRDLGRLSESFVPKGWTHRTLPDGTSWYMRYPRFKDPKGGDWDEWPEPLRVREYPTPRPPEE